MFSVFNYGTLLCITFTVKSKKWKQNFKFVYLHLLCYIIAMHKVQ